MKKFDYAKRSFNIAMRQKLAEYAIKHHWVFCKEILKFKDIDNEFHKRACARIGNDELKDKGYLFPRGHLKTSLITVGNTLRLVCKNPNWRHLILNARADFAEDQLVVCEEYIANGDSFNYFYPHIRPKDLKAQSWSRSKCTVNRTAMLPNATIEAQGILSHMTGRHMERIVFDDLVDDKNSDTLEKKKALLSAYQLTLSLLEPGGWRDMLGTRYFYDDAYNWIIKNEEYAWLISQVYTGPQGRKTPPGQRTYIFPQKFNDEIYARITAGQSNYHVSCQYFNDPVDEETQTFKRSYIQYFDDLRVENEDGQMEDIVLAHYIAVDPASGKGGNRDKTAIVVIGVDFKGHIYVIECIYAHLTFSQIVENTRILHDRYFPLSIIVETQTGFIGLQETYANEIEKKGMMPVGYVYSPPTKNAKQIRIESMEPKAKAMMMFFKDNDPIIAMLIDQLVRYPANKDDLADAFAWAVRGALPPDPIGDEEDDEPVVVFKRGGV
jgi:predicted phage terminase large subunit-like protein